MIDTFDTGETVDLTPLHAPWRQLDVLYRRVTSLSRSRESRLLTAKKFDESQTAGHRVYFSADRYLAVAMDNHRALQAVLEHHGATHSAPWSMMRTVFEAAFTACWVMDPDDGLERRRRGLRCEVRDHMERNNFIREYQRSPETAESARAMLRSRREPERVYRSEATALRMSWDTAKGKWSVVDELPKLSCVKHEEPTFQVAVSAQWRLLSGFDHGLGWALNFGSDTSAHAEIPGGTEMIVTMNDTAFVVAGQCSAWLFAHALARRERLHTRTE